MTGLWAALRSWNLPTYPQAVLDDYFSDRYIMYSLDGYYLDGKVRSHKVTCGVPQGSILL